MQKKENTNSRFIKLTEYLQTLGHQRFTGYIKINFSEGHIGRIERFEEILKNTKEPDQHDQPKN